MRAKIIINKGRYLCNVIIKSFILGKQDKTCPFCNSLETRKIMDKFFFLKLFRCNNCSLMFRYPKDKVDNRYYCDARYYDEPKTSALPTNAELIQFKNRNFKGSVYDVSDKIAIIKKYMHGGNLFDYGAAWGYNLWQFIHQGFSGLGYEIAIERAKFGEENLGLKIIYDAKELGLLESSFDIIFANHALEHITDIRSEFNRIYKLLKPGGYLFIFVPDCSDIDQEPWKKIYAFGKRHCIAFDKDFFYENLSSLGFRLIEIKEHALDEYELMVVAQKKDYAERHSCLVS